MRSFRGHKNYVLYLSIISYKGDAVGRIDRRTTKPALVNSGSIRIRSEKLMLKKWSLEKEVLFLHRTSKVIGKSSRNSIIERYIFVIRKFISGKLELGARDITALRGVAGRTAKVRSEKNGYDELLRHDDVRQPPLCYFLSSPKPHQLVAIPLEVLARLVSIAHAQSAHLPVI